MRALDDEQYKQAVQREKSLRCTWKSETGSGAMQQVHSRCCVTRVEAALAASRWPMTQPRAVWTGMGKPPTLGRSRWANSTFQATKSICDGVRHAVHFRLQLRGLHGAGSAWQKSKLELSSVGGTHIFWMGERVGACAVKWSFCGWVGEWLMEPMLLLSPLPVHALLCSPCCQCHLLD